MLPDVAVRGPRVVAELAGARHRVEGPAQLAVLCVVRFYPATRAEIAARETGDDEAVIIERCAGNGVTEFRIFRLHRPDDLAGDLIERHELRVQLSDKHFALAQPEPAPDPGTAGARDLGIDAR